MLLFQPAACSHTYYAFERFFAPPPRDERRQARFMRAC